MDWDWVGSPGGRGYRAPYGANNPVFLSCDFLRMVPPMNAFLSLCLPIFGASYYIFGRAVRVWPPAPFGPESGSNVARGSSVLYLTRGG